MIKFKIFLYTVEEDGTLVGIALAEDGTGLAVCRDISTNIIRDNLTTSFSNIKEYKSHYPSGYQIVDLMDLPFSDLISLPSFAGAIRLNYGSSI